MDHALTSTDRRRRLIGGVLLVITIGALGTIYSSLHPLQTTIDELEPDSLVVQLRHATLPMPLQPIAIHYWFVIFKPDKNFYRRRQRWELWQDADAGGTSWGHVHRNLMDPDVGVGGGAPVIDVEWHGDAASRIAAVLNAPEQYPYRGYYHAWPGPNSNTYAAWTLRQAGVPFDFDPRAIGKDFRGMIGGGISGSRSGIQIDTPILGAQIGLREGVELHILCFTFGVDFWTPALKTPLGRYGYRDPL